MREAATEVGAPGPAGEPWPASAVFGPRGLEIGGVPVGEIADAFGTPVLVADEDEIRQRARAFARSFPRAAYAVKALTVRAVIGIALEEGLALLVASGGELEACLRAGAPPERIVFHGNNKSEAELRRAIETKIGLVNLDNAEELATLEGIAAELGREQPVLVRVVPEVAAGAHRAIETGGPESKFGFLRDDALAAVAAVQASPSLRLAGVHGHIGSQVLDPDPLLAEIGALVGFLAEVRGRLGVEAEVLDVGGGFGVAYTQESPAFVPELASTLLSRLRREAGRAGIATPTLMVEPGRSVVANAAVTVYRAGARKSTAGGRTLLAVDGGMSDNVRPMLYGARCSVAHAGPPTGAAPAAFTIVGRHCESGDVLAEQVDLPGDLAAGALLAFAATGAYAYSMASNYNRVGRPPIVAVRGGEVRALVRREQTADLDRLDVSPGPGAPAGAPPAGVMVRAARPGDAASFLGLWRSVVAESRFVRTEEVRHPARHYRRRFRRSWTEREAQLVAVAGGDVVGHLFAERDGHEVTRHVATLGIAVAGPWRGLGVGSALMDEAFRWAREVGVEKLVLSVYPHNEAAIALYRKLGFVEEGRLVRHSRKSYGYEDEILMARWLGDGE